MTTNRPAAAAATSEGLAADLREIRARRRALGLLATAAGSVITGPARAADAAITSCVADPEETAGPYPADGTNHASGSTSDVLTASGVVRRDIRSSFLGSSTVAAGVPTALTLTLVDANSGCAPLAGYAVYLWHCDRDGLYSLYTASAESYLRGVQVSNSAGKVTFITIFPGCYSGRYPHMHFEVFPSLALATSGRNAVLTSQLAMPAAACADVYANAAGYSQSLGNFNGVSLASDNVFGDNTSAQLAAMTPSLRGASGTGFLARATVGLAL